jgi:hypothetical protein
MRHTDALANLDRLAASTLKTGARCVYLALQVRTDDNGLCWPSIETVANDAGLSRSATQRNVARLITTGFIGVERGGGRGHTNLYRLTVEVVPNRRVGATVSDRERVAFDRLKGRVWPPKGSRPRDPNGMNGLNARPAVEEHPVHPAGECVECDAGRRTLARYINGSGPS